MKKRFLFIKATLVSAVISFLLLFGQAPAEANPFSGDYYGSVTVNSPTGLGSIDLAFHLELDDSGKIIPAKSYISLEKTVLFPKVGKVDDTDVGPMVQSGYLRSNGFQLTTRPFTTLATQKSVTRQISLNNGVVTQAGNTISGTYTETMSGYLPTSIKTVGKFVLVRPVSVTEGFPCCQDTMAPKGTLTIKEIRAGGKDPTVVEFEDISCAMRYYRGLASGLKVSPLTLKGAITEYQNYLKTTP